MTALITGAVVLSLNKLFILQVYSLRLKGLLTLRCPCAEYRTSTAANLTQITG